MTTGVPRNDFQEDAIPFGLKMAPLKPRLPKGLLKKVPLRNNWGETFGVPQNCPKGKDLNPCPVQETRNVIKDLTVKGDKIELRGPRKVAPSLS